MKKSRKERECLSLGRSMLFCLKFLAAPKKCIESEDFTRCHYFTTFAFAFLVLSITTVEYGRNHFVGVSGAIILSVLYGLFGMAAEFLNRTVSCVILKYAFKILKLKSEFQSWGYIKRFYVIFGFIGLMGQLMYMFIGVVFQIKLEAVNISLAAAIAICMFLVVFYSMKKKMGLDTMSAAITGFVICGLNLLIPYALDLVTPAIPGK